MARQTISIHALLAESDSNFYLWVVQRRNFYPRSPCGERRKMQQTRRPMMLFLSTLSLRRATHGTSGSVFERNHFYPRSPCGERLSRDDAESRLDCISIHALLAESDLTCYDAMLMGQQFLSTLSLRRATTAGLGNLVGDGIFLSTLSLRRATGTSARFFRHRCRFLSTLSLRRATCAPATAASRLLFLSTLSLRRATHYRRNADRNTRFLSTLSLRRATIG